MVEWMAEKMVEKMAEKMVGLTVVMSADLKVAWLELNLVV